MPRNDRIGQKVIITMGIAQSTDKPVDAQTVLSLVVRRARPGETLTTLDETERVLDEQDLLITDSPDGEGSRIIGIAGVMGERYSEVEDSTVDVLLEAAHFDSVSIARSSRRHRLHSEAAKRFERGTDPLLPAVAAQRAVELLVEYGGGCVCGGGRTGRLPACGGGGLHRVCGGRRIGGEKFAAYAERFVCRGAARQLGFGECARGVGFGARGMGLTGESLCKQSHRL